MFMCYTPLESFIKADIFFVVTTIAVIFVTLFFIIALFYFIKLIRNFYKISKILRKCASDTDGELRELGEQIRQSPLFVFLFGKEKKKKEKEHSASKKVI